MDISLIASMDKNRVIGYKNKIPWYIKEDLAYFRRMTLGNVVVMGRKTYQSIDKYLDGRINVILTRNDNFHIPGYIICHSVGEVLDKFKNISIFVIGGAEVFSNFIKIANKLYITLVDYNFEGDTYFPEIDFTIWKETSRRVGNKDEKTPYNYYFLVYERFN